MKHCTLDGIPYLLLRVRDTSLSLLNTTTLTYLTLPITRLGELSPTPLHRKELMPNCVPFSQRPREYWDTLREQRKQVALAGPSKKRGEGMDWERKVDDNRGAPKVRRAPAKGVKVKGIPPLTLIELRKMPIPLRVQFATMLGYTLPQELLS